MWITAEIDNSLKFLGFHDNLDYPNYQNLKKKNLLLYESYVLRVVKAPLAY